MSICIGLDYSLNWPVGLQVLLFSVQADLLGFVEALVQSRHWFGQVLLPALLRVFSSDYQFWQHVGRVSDNSQICFGLLGRSGPTRLQIGNGFTKLPQ